MIRTETRDGIGGGGGGGGAIYIYIYFFFQGTVPTKQNKIRSNLEAVTQCTCILNKCISAHCQAAYYRVVGVN